MLNDTIKFKELENKYFPSGHTFYLTRNLLNREIYTVTSGKEYWDRRRRCINLLNDYCKYLSETGREYTYNLDTFDLVKNKIRDDNISSYEHIIIEKNVTTTSRTLMTETICIDDIFKLDDCSLIYGECDKSFDRLYDRQYNHNNDSDIYQQFKVTYEEYKNNGTLNKIEPYMSWIDNTLCNNLTNVPRSIISIIACHCCNIINNGCPLTDKVYDDELLNSFQCRMFVDLIKKMFTFKYKTMLLTDSDGKPIYNIINENEETEDIVHSIRRRISTNPYKTTCEIYN